MRPALRFAALPHCLPVSPLAFRVSQQKHASTVRNTTMVSQYLRMSSQVGSRNCERILFGHIYHTIIRKSSRLVAFPLSLSRPIHRPLSFTPPIRKSKSHSSLSLPLQLLLLLLLNLSINLSTLRRFVSVEFGLNFNQQNPLHNEI